MDKVYEKLGPDMQSTAGKYQIQYKDKVQNVPVSKDKLDKRQGIELPNCCLVICNKCPKHTGYW